MFFFLSDFGQQRPNFAKKKPKLAKYWENNQKLPKLAKMAKNLYHFGFLAISQQLEELPEIRWCQNNRIYEGFSVTCVGHTA